MATKDLHSSISVVAALAPAAVSDNTASTGATIDLQGYESVEFAVVSGALADVDATFALKVQHGDLANAGDMADVPAADLLGTAAGASFTFADDGVAKKVGYRGIKRYVRIVITPANNTGSSIFGAVAIRSHARSQPA